jgi:CRP-like cAMP-binding protein
VKPRAARSIVGPLFPDGTSERLRVGWCNKLANLTILDRAKGNTVSRLLKCSTFETYGGGETIMAEGAPCRDIFVLVEGLVRMSMRGPSDLRYSPKTFCAPTHFGDLAGLSGLPFYQVTATAVGSTIAARIPLPEVERLLAEDHGLSLAWLYSVARQHSITIDADRQSVFGGAQARLTNAFLANAAVFGVRDGDRVLIDHPLSYRSLSEQAGCTRRTAINGVNRLEKRRILERASGGWLVDVDGLREQLQENALSLAHSFADVRVF